MCNVALLVGGVLRRGTKDPLPQQQPLDPSAVLRLPGHRARLPGEPTVAVIAVVVFSFCEMRPCRDLCSKTRVLHDPVQGLHYDAVQNQSLYLLPSVAN